MKTKDLVSTKDGIVGYIESIEGEHCRIKRKSDGKVIRERLKDVRPVSAQDSRIALNPKNKPQLDD